MKTLYPDLFPETLLVDREGGHIFTTSVKMAEHFGKRHDNVMKAIRKAIEESPKEEQLLNFEELFDTYTVKNGAQRKRQIFRLTHDGFMFVAQGFTGAEANTWKWKFISAFREMERQLLAQKDRESTALYKLRPRWPAIIQNPHLPRLQLIEQTGHKSPGSITACRRRMRTIGLID